MDHVRLDAQVQTPALSSIRDTGETLPGHSGPGQSYCTDKTPAEHSASPMAVDELEDDRGSRVGADSKTPSNRNIAS